MTKQYHYCPLCGQSLEEPVDGAYRQCDNASCTFVHYDNPLPVVAAIVEHEGAIILGRNVGWPASWYGLITGFLEKRESPEEGILREVEEELGLMGEISDLVGVYDFQKRNQLIVAYHVKAAGVIELGEELADIKRVQPEHLKPWGFGTGLAVRDWLNKNGIKTNT